MGKVLILENAKKSLALIVIFSIALPTLSMLVITPANAQSLPTPAVPEFTVRLVNNSYSTQPTITTTTDPYTGKQTTKTVPGQYVENDYIEVSIKNQAFTPYTINYHNIDNRTVNLYFNVRSKGHFSQDWNVTPQGGGSSQIENYSSQYTLIKLYVNNVPALAQIDFEAQAFIGYPVNQLDPYSPLPPPNVWDPNIAMNGTVSSWSNPQTLTIGQTAASVTPTAAIPEFPTMSLLPLVALIPVAMAFKLKKTRR